MFTTLIINPYEYYKSNTSSKSHPSLTLSQQNKLRKLYTTNHSDQFIINVIPTIDPNESKLLSKQFTKPLQVELTKQFKSLNEKHCSKRLNLDDFYNGVQQQLQSDPKSPHFSIKPDQITTLFTIIYQYLSKQLPDLFTAASQSIQQQQSTNDNDTVIPIDKTVQKLQQITSLLLLLLNIKPLVKDYVWNTKVCKYFTYLRFEQEHIDFMKKSKKALFNSIFDANELNQIISVAIGHVNIDTTAHDLIKSIQREYNRATKQKDKGEKTDKVKNDQKESKIISNDTSQGDMNDGDDNTNNKQQKQSTNDKNDKNAQTPTDSTTSQSQRFRYVDANYIWEPTYEDQLYAISQLKVGQVRFGVIQGIEDKLGIFVDTWQNHVKIRCLCGFGYIYDNKIMRTKIGKNDEKGSKLTQKQHNGSKYHKNDDMNDKDGKRDERDEKFDKNQRHNAKAYTSEQVMKFAKKQYQIGDRVSFIITDIAQPFLPTNTNNKKSGSNNQHLPSKPSKSGPQLPKVFASFTNYHFKTLAKRFAYQHALVFKYLLYLKYIQIRNKLLFSQTLQFYPPRFIDQIVQMPILNQYLSEYVLCDSKFLSMSLTPIATDYATKWFKERKLQLPTEKGSQNIKREIKTENNNNITMGIKSEQLSDDDSDDEGLNTTQSNNDVAELSKLTGEFEQLTESDDENDIIQQEQQQNPQLTLILSHIRTDPMLNQFFGPNLNVIKSYQNIVNNEGIGTMVSFQFFTHNKYTTKHYHSSPGLNSATFYATTKEAQLRQSMIQYSSEQLSQIYLQSNNFIRSLMSLQPFPQTTHLSLNKKSLVYHYCNEFTREKEIAKFFGDSERYELLEYNGTKHFKYINRLNKLKSRQLRIIVDGLNQIHPDNQNQLQTMNDNGTNINGLEADTLDSGDNEFNFLSQKIDFTLFEHVMTLFASDQQHKQHTMNDLVDDNETNSKKGTKQGEKGEKGEKGNKSIVKDVASINNIVSKVLNGKNDGTTNKKGKNDGKTNQQAKNDEKVIKVEKSIKNEKNVKNELKGSKTTKSAPQSTMSDELLPTTDISATPTKLSKSTPPKSTKSKSTKSSKSSKLIDDEEPTQPQLQLELFSPLPLLSPSLHSNKASATTIIPTTPLKPVKKVQNVNKDDKKGQNINNDDKKVQNMNKDDKNGQNDTNDHNDDISQQNKRQRNNTQTTTTQNKSNATKVQKAGGVENVTSELKSTDLVQLAPVPTNTTQSTPDKNKGKSITTNNKVNGNKVNDDSKNNNNKNQSKVDKTTTTPVPTDQSSIAPSKATKRGRQNESTQTTSKSASTTSTVTTPPPSTTPVKPNQQQSKSQPKQQSNEQQPKQPQQPKQQPSTPAAPTSTPNQSTPAPKSNPIPKPRGRKPKVIQQDD